MKILHIYDGLSEINGGSQSAALTWVKELNKQGLTVKLLSNSYEKDSSLKPFILEIPNTDLEFILINLSISFISFSKLKTILENFSPDIIHLHEPHLVAIQSAILAKKMNIPVIMSYHTDYPKMTQHSANLKFKIGTYVVGKLQLFLLKRAFVITVPSKSVIEQLPLRLQEKAVVLPYPISQYFMNNLKKNYDEIPTKLITISRLSSEKKLDFLIDVLAKLKGEFTLTIVGDGFDRTFLEKKVKLLSLEKVVKITGWISNKELPALMASHDLYISASQMETFGITYAESSLVGLPNVAVDYTTSKEVLDNRGVFISEMIVDTWVHTLLSLQKDTSKYKKLVRETATLQKKFSRYTVENSVKALIRIYTDTIHHSLKTN